MAFDDDIRVRLSPDGSQVVIGALREVGVAATRIAGDVARSLVTFLPRTLEAIDSQLKMARQLRATSEGLETLRRAANLAGVSEKQLETATRNLEVRLGEAAKGAREPKDALDRLGITVEQLSKLDADARVALINQRLRETVPAAERAAVAGDLFGTKVAGAMGRITGEDLATAREEVRALGLAVSEVDAQTIERANDAISTMSEVARGAANRVTVALGPIIDAIAQKIRRWAIESEGFRDEIELALDVAVNLAGLAADAFRGLEVIFKSLQLAGQTWLAFMLEQLALLPRFVTTILEAIVSQINSFIRLANNIPGVDLSEIVLTGHDTLPREIEEMGASVRATAETTRAELEALAGKPLPSEGLRALVAEIKASADEISRQQIALRNAAEFKGEVKQQVSPEDQRRLDQLRKSLQNEEGTERASHEIRMKELRDFLSRRIIGIAEFNQLEQAAQIEHEAKLRELQAKRDEQWQRLRDQRIADLESVREYLMSAQEQETAAHVKRLEQLIAASEELNLTEEEYRRLREELEEKHQAKMGNLQAQGAQQRKKFEAMSMKDQAKTIFGELSNITAGVAQHNKTLFKINQVSGIANAIINAYEGISRTLAAYPYPINLAMAAGHALAAFAQVNAIRGASFEGGGGGVAPSLAGSTPATPVTPVTSGTGVGASSSPTVFNVFVSGGRSSIEELANNLKALGAEGFIFNVK